MDAIIKPVQERICHSQKLNRLYGNEQIYTACTTTAKRTQCHKTIINFEPSIKGIAYN